MKKILYLFVLLLLASCTGGQKTERLTSQNDSLAVAVAQKDSVLNEVFSSLSTVTENLNAIKSRENIINENMMGSFLYGLWLKLYLSENHQCFLRH